MRKLYIETRISILSTIFFLFHILILIVLFFFCRYENFFLWFLFPIAVFFLVFFIAWYWVIIPYRRSKHLMQLFATGYSLTGLIDEKNPLNHEMEIAQDKLTELLNTDQMMNLSKRQAQFLALQNQINPHFLYNTLEGIRSEALVAGLESVANMTEALSTFFRYTISYVENLVTLKMELDNTENYFFIQQYRFGTRLHLSIEIDGDDKDRILRCKIPKLTLQPIVENSIIHGLECKVGEGNLRIKIIATSSRMLINVSDDGIGMDESVLHKIQDGLEHRSFEYVKTDKSKNGIALENVNNRIKLVFGEQYGLSLESCLGVGTDVHISLPLSTEGDDK
ncbi:MAG: histidine kinase [Treponema sp.]|nr:histidine kinase [Treponema sp.]